MAELATLSEAHLVPQAVLQALEVKEQPSRPVIRTLSDYLESRKLLLVLDNAEHVLEGCVPLVDEVLRRSRDTAILVTSRERLGMTGELTYRVPSLRVPGPNETSTPETLSAYDGVRLFVQRAKLARSGFALTARNASAVASICARLDGMPLAIELAAVRLRSMSVDELSERLDQRFALLTDGSRAVLPRHRTLRSVIDWSYDLLSDSEQAMLHRVAVFAGGWTLASAERVCASDGIEVSDVLERLTSLVDKSLVVADEQAGTTRYRMLETVRQYALDRLREHGEEARWRSAHLACFIALANEFDEGIDGPRQQWWFSRIASEHDNLRAALAFAARSSPLEGLELAINLHAFFLVRGHLTEGREWYARLLDAFPVDGPKRERARGLNGAAQFAAEQGDRAPAKRLLQESVALFREIGDVTASHQNALYTLAYLTIQEGDYSEGEALSREAVGSARAKGESDLLCAGLDNLARALHAQGRWDAARECYEECLEVARERGTPFVFGCALKSVGVAEGTERLSEPALKHLAEGIRILHGLGHRMGVIESLEGIAGVFATMAAPRRAVRLWGASDAMRQEMGGARSAHESAIHERQLEPVRAILTAQEFARAWDEGRTMSLDDAVRCALDEEVRIEA